MEPFTSSPSGAGVSSGSRIFCCASAVWPGSSDGVTLAGYKSWRRSVAVKQRPPCLYACVCASCVCACVREREGGRGGGGVQRRHSWWMTGCAAHTEHTLARCDGEGGMHHCLTETRMSWWVRGLQGAHNKKQTESQSQLLLLLSKFTHKMDFLWSVKTKP